MSSTRRDLLEFVQQPTARIDREKRMIYGLKLMGHSSANRHGLDGINGTEYTQEAFASAIPLYEGKAGYVNHPDRKNAGAERSVLDKALTYRNVRAEKDGVYGDAEYLDAHPFTPMLLEAVEKRPHWLTLSHNAVGEGAVKGGKYQVHRILEVRSVDIVGQGATTKTLFESRETPMTLREKLIAAGVPTKKINLLEEGYPDLKPGLTPQAEPEAEPEMTWKQHLAAALTALLADETAGGGDDRKAWIMQMIDMLNGHPPEAAVVPPLAGGDVPAEAPGEEAEDVLSDDGEPMEPDEDEEVDPMKKITKESAEWKEFSTFRREKAAREDCKKAGFTPSDKQVSILASLTESVRGDTIAEFKAMQANTRASGPRSVSRDTLESKSQTVPSKVEDFVASITR